MSNFEVIIGIENHVELKTKTKLFSPGEVAFGKEPNTCINERDLGYPGILPTLNRKCVELAILASNALKMKIDNLLKFDRKNYYYSDLPKGYQITQQFNPIGREGYIEFDINGKSKRINIERLHIEEDTAKQIHAVKTKIDYNRSGVGLIEIVSKPEIRSSEEAALYVSKLREILLFLGVSDVKMNEGSLRCDVNISMRPVGSKEFGKRVEVKNLNSISNVKKAIEFEIKRQTKLLLNNQEIKQETMRFNEQTQETFAIRSKEDSVDYKYFREPNIPPVQLDKKWIKDVINSSPELASQKREKYINKLNLTDKETEYILQDLQFVNFFETCISNKADPKKVANIIINDLKDLLNKNNIDLQDCNIKPNDISYLFELLNNGKISTKHLKSIIIKKFETNEEIDKIIKENKFIIISDVKEIVKILSKIISNQREFIISEYSERPQRVEKTIMGLLMKETEGNVNPEIGMKVIIDEIKKIK